MEGRAGYQVVFMTGRGGEHQADTGGEQPTAVRHRRAPLERVAERHPEEVRMESVEAVVQPGRRHLVEDRLTSPAAPVTLADELIRKVRRQRLPELHRRARC